MAKDGTTTDSFDLEGLSDEEILALPASNLPPSLLADYLARRDSALQKQETAQTETAEQVVSRQRAYENTDIDDLQRYAQVFSEYEIAMRDIEEREDELLKRLDEQERWTKKRLADIEKRTLKLQDGTRAYVGTNGTYLDEKGNTLQGTRLLEARAEHQQHANAATWTERADVIQQQNEQQRLRQEILDAREQRRLDTTKNLSSDDMESRTRDRSAAMARYETEFQEQLNTRRQALSSQPVTDDVYGDADYMAAYANSGRTISHAGATDGINEKGLLVKAFDPAATGQGPQTPSPDFSRNKVPPAPTLTR